MSILGSVWERRARKSLGKFPKVWAVPLKPWINTKSNVFFILQTIQMSESARGAELRLLHVPAADGEDEDVCWNIHLHVESLNCDVVSQVQR